MHHFGVAGDCVLQANCSTNSPAPTLYWQSLGVLELTALRSIDYERWVTWVRGTDVLLVNGCDALSPLPLDAAVRAGGSLAVAR